MALSIGDRCPDFESITDEGTKFNLSEHVGKSNLVLYFYPKDNTPGCTTEACSFRDNWDRLKPYDVEIFGISSDSQDSHTRFKDKYNLPFTLLSDSDKKIRNMFGATGRLIPPRITFVIDRKGIIRSVYNSQLKPGNHIEEVMKALKDIESEKDESVGDSN